MPKNKTQRSRPVKTPAPRRPSKAAVQHLPQKLQETLSALTYLEYQFVLNYVGKARGNGTLAAQLAGMGNSYATNASQASMLLQKATVRQAIDAWMTQFALSAAELTWQVRDISQANMSPFVQWQADGTLKLKTLDEETWLAHAHWIKEIETDPKSGQVLKIVLHDAQAARRDLAKILKLYSDAPIFLFGMQARQMSDAELIAQLEAVRAEEKAQGRLAPTTGQVAVVPAPEDQP